MCKSCNQIKPIWPTYIFLEEDTWITSKILLGGAHRKQYQEYLLVQRFEQLASPREFETLNMNFPSFWLFLIVCLLALTLKAERNWVLSFSLETQSSFHSLLPIPPREAAQTSGAQGSHL